MCVESAVHDAHGLAQPVPTPVAVWLNAKVGMKLSANGNVYGVWHIHNMFEY